MSRLTGKTRFRTGLFGQMILQVETTKSVTRYPDEIREYNTWRDATTKDVLSGDLVIREVFDIK